MAHSYQVPFLIGSRVSIKDSDIFGTVTSIIIRDNGFQQSEVVWFAQGQQHTAWIDTWRLEERQP